MAQIFSGVTEISRVTETEVLVDIGENLTDLQTTILLECFPQQLPNLGRVILLRG